MPTDPVLAVLVILTGIVAPLLAAGFVLLLIHLQKRSGAGRTPGTVQAAEAAGKQAMPYRAAPSLLTPTEVQFYRVLAEAAGPMATIQCKVRLADLLIAPERDITAFRRVSQKHVDFVLCDRQSLRPLVAVELDDRSHDRAERRERDAFVDSAYAAAGIPLVHVKVANAYNAAEVLALVQPFLLLR